MSTIDELFRVSDDGSAPLDEARDANRQLVQQLARGLSHRDLIPRDEILSWTDRIALQDPDMLKAVGLVPNLRPSPYPENTRRERPHSSILYVNELGYVGPGTTDPWADKARPQSGFEFLREMAQNIDFIQAIIHTRVHQLAPFMRRYREDDNNPLGMRLVRRDGERLTKDDEKAIDRLWSILENSGVETDPVTRRWINRTRSFAGFNAALIADTLTYDACPIDLERAQNGKLLRWYNTDPCTVRLAYDDGYLGDDKLVAVQLAPQERRAVVGFEADDIIFEVRNPRSSIYQYDYGQSELELFVKGATSYLNTFAFNAASLDRNTIPRGFLTVYGDYDKRQIKNFEDKWEAFAAGVSRRWRMPVLFAKNRQEGGANWTTVDQQVAEMFHTKWLVFIVSLGCALYGIAPEEINFESFSSRTSSLSGSDTSEKLQSSHDRGLIPLALFDAEQLWNNQILPQVDPKYMLTYVGLFPDDEARKHERQKLTLTVDEMRAQDGVEPHPDPNLGGAPTNPALMSVYAMALQQQQQQDAMGGMGGGGFGDALPGSERPVRPLEELNAGGGGGQPPMPGAGQPQPGRPGSGTQPQPPGFQKAGLAAPTRLVVEIRELPPGADWA